jgi:hypothetical protein
MQVIIDKLDEINDWIPVDSVIDKERLDYPIDGINTCLKVGFLEQGYVEKTFTNPIDLLYSDTFVISIPLFSEQSEFAITLSDSNGLTKAYYAKLNDKQTYYLFSRNELIDLSYVRITFFSETIVLLCNMLASYDELPFDIGIGIKKLLETKTKDIKFLLGKSDITLNSNNIRISGQPKIIERYSVLEFDGEIHQVESYKAFNNYYEVTFTQLYDGRVTKTSGIDIDVNLIIPVLSFPKDIEANNPCIVIESGFVPTVNQYLQSEYENIVHEDSEGNFYLLSNECRLNYKLTLHGIYRYTENKSALIEIYNWLIGTNHVVFINGRRYPIMFENLQDVNESDINELQVTTNINLESNKWKKYKRPSEAVEVKINLT